MGLPRLAWSSLTASAVLIAALATPAQSQQPQQQPGSIRSNHGAWSVICDKPAGASEEQCALMQNVIAEDRPEVGLSVVVLKTADRKARILRILSPLGVHPGGPTTFLAASAFAQWLALSVAKLTLV